MRPPAGTQPCPAGQSLSRLQTVAMILAAGAHMPTRAVEPFGAAPVAISRQLDPDGQSPSLRHIVLQNGWPGKSGAATQRVSFAQRLPSAGFAEQAAP